MCVCVCVKGVVRGVTFQLCLMPGSFGKSSSSAGMACISEGTGASKRDNNSLKVKIEISGGGSTLVPQLFFHSFFSFLFFNVMVPTPSPQKADITAQTPRLARFHPKAPQLMLFFYFFFPLLQIWFSVELSVTRVDDTSWEKVNPYSLIKSDIPIHSHAGPAFIERRDRGNQTFWFWFGNPSNVKVQLILLFF